MKLLLLSLLLLSNTALAESSVWKVSNGQHSLFIAGTIHVLRPEDYPLPAAFDRAYLQADRIVLETDLNNVSSNDFRNKLTSYFAYQNKATLKSAINHQTYEALQQYCLKAGVPLSSLLPFKPQFVSLMLTSIELSRLGVNTRGVDQHYNERASKDRKPVDELETLEQQLHFLANMGAGKEDELILSTIKENQQLGKLMLTILSAWRNGNNHQLNHDILMPMKQEFPGIYQDLVVDRNNDWLPRIRAYLETAETEMILVGSLHLVGDDGLIRQLRSRGYDIVQL
jgi:uncharacterized protein YbaP (TraB family)